MTSAMSWGSLRPPNGMRLPLHLGLRVGKIGAQVGVVPDDISVQHGVGVAKVGERPGLATIDAAQRRPDGVGLFAVAGGAGLENYFAMSGIGRACRCRGECQNKRDGDPRHNHIMHGRAAPDF